MEVQEFIQKVILQLNKSIFTDDQLLVIEGVLMLELNNKIIQDINRYVPKNNEEAINLFIASKKVEGCSSKSIKFSMYSPSRNRPALTVTVSCANGIY